MKLFSYSVYDVKVQIYNTPFFFPHDVHAIRAFERLRQDPQSFVSQHPDDYQLYCVGEFDDTRGRLKSCAPRLIQMPTIHLEPTEEDV